MTSDGVLSGQIPSLRNLKCPQEIMRVAVEAVEVAGME